MMRSVTRVFVPRDAAALAVAPGRWVVVWAGVGSSPGG